MHSPLEKPNPDTNHHILRYCLYAAVLAAVACGSFWGAWRVTSFRRSQAQVAQIPTDFQLLQWGSIPKPFQMKSILGQTINIPSPDRCTFIQYISKETTRTQQVILYAQYLARERFPGRVNYVAVVNPSEGDLVTSLREMNIPDVAVSVDRDNRFLQHFALPSNLDSAIAIDNSGTVRFSAVGLVMQDALRNLFSRYAGAGNDKQITDDTPMRPYRIGEVMPSFEVQDIRTGKTFSSLSLVNPIEHPLWIFTADCAMCSLPSYFDKFSRASAPGSIPIFSSRVPSPILTSIAKKSGYQGPLYVAAEEIPIFEDLLHNRSLTPYAAVVNISKDGRLLNVTPQTPY